MCKIDILTLNYNDAETTISFVNNVRRFAEVGTVLVVDNNSSDNSYRRLTDELSPFKNVEIISTCYNGGYGAGNNFGIKHLVENCSSKWILLSNPDVVVSEKTIVSMKNFLENNLDCAIVAPVMTDINGVKLEYTAVDIPTVWQYILSLDCFWSKYCSTFRYKNLFVGSKGVKLVGAVSGSMFMMNAEHMLKYGMYDENIFLYCEEVVLGLKLRKKGLSTVLLLDDTFVHNQSVSISKSYKSGVKRQSLLLKSKLYVIKNYYNANWFQYSVAIILSFVSKFEMFIISILKKMFFL